MPDTPVNKRYSLSDLRHSIAHYCSLLQFTTAPRSTASTSSSSSPYQYALPPSAAIRYLLALSIALIDLCTIYLTSRHHTNEIVCFQSPSITQYHTPLHTLTHQHLLFPTSTHPPATPSITYQQLSPPPSSSPPPPPRLLSPTTDHHHYPPYDHYALMLKLLSYLPTAPQAHQRWTISLSSRTPARRKKGSKKPYRTG